MIILAEVWKTTPFMALLLLAGLALVPDELHEAAKVDGASALQRFFRITLPLMKPAILVALLFRTLDAFRIFDSASSSRPGGANGTETVSILGYNALITRVNLGLGSAISVLIFICVILIAVVVREGASAPAPPSSEGRPDERTPRARRVLWAIGILVVLLLRADPGAWIVVAVAQDAPTSSATASSSRHSPFDNYDVDLHGRHLHCARCATRSASRRSRR